MKRAKTQQRAGLSAIAVALQLALAACGSDAATSADGVPIEEVKVGTCGAMASEDVFGARFQPGGCTGEHAMEVVGRFELSDADYSGDQAS